MFYIRNTFSFYRISIFTLANWQRVKTTHIYTHTQNVLFDFPYIFYFFLYVFRLSFQCTQTFPSIFAYTYFIQHCVHTLHKEHTTTISFLLFFFFFLIRLLPTITRHLIHSWKLLPFLLDFHVVSPIVYKIKNENNNPEIN